MATRLKTIEYILPRMLTDIAESSTHTDSADTTIYIPETSSRVFKSVVLQFFCHDNHSTISANETDISLRGSCDSGSTWTTVDCLAYTSNQTGENRAHDLMADMTAEFTSRFGTGTSGTFRYGWFIDCSAAGPTYTNVCAKLIITYEFDDSSATTRIKTVRIPIESYNGRLSDTATEIKQTSTASNQIPLLDTFLPEASKTYRQIFVELYTAAYPSTTTSTTLIMKIDSGGAEDTWGTFQGSNQSPMLNCFLWDISAITTSAAHALYARHTVAAGSYFLLLGGWVTVTYEYDHSSSTSIMNSLMLPFGPCNFLGGVARIPVKLYIEEPATIAIAQSGVMVSYYQSFGNAPNMSVGSQTATTYASNSAALTTFVVHRFDSGGHAGAGGVSLSRGKNEFNINFSIPMAEGNIGFMGMILNYTSGKHTNGDGVHNRTILYWNTFMAYRANSTYGTVTWPAIYIPETSYFLQNFALSWIAQAVTAGQDYKITITYLAGDTIGAGTFRHTLHAGNTSEVCDIPGSYDLSRFFWRYPSDLDTFRVDPEQSRTTSQLIFSAFGFINLFAYTYHSITYTCSGTIAGSNAGTVSWYAISKSFGISPIATGSRSGNGTYSFTWYDDTANDVFVRAREDSTHVGSSDDGAGT